MATIRELKTATIANGEALSTGVSARNQGLTPVGVISPVAWTAAGLDFEISYDNGTTYVPLYDEGARYVVSSLTTAEIRYHALNSQLFLGATHVKARSITVATGAAANQGAARSLIFVFRTL